MSARAKLAAAAGLLAACLLTAAGCSSSEGASSAPGSWTSSVTWGDPLAQVYGEGEAAASDNASGSSAPSEAGPVAQAAREVAPDARFVSASTASAATQDSPAPVWVYLFASEQQQALVVVTESGGAHAFTIGVDARTAQPFEVHS